MVATWISLLFPSLPLSSPPVPYPRCHCLSNFREVSEVRGDAGVRLVGVLLDVLEQEGDELVARARRSHQLRHCAHAVSRRHHQLVIVIAKILDEQTKTLIATAAGRIGSVDT